MGTTQPMVVRNVAKLWVMAICLLAVTGFVSYLAQSLVALSAGVAIIVLVAGWSAGACRSEQRTRGITASIVVGVAALAVGSVIALNSINRFTSSEQAVSAVLLLLALVASVAGWWRGSPQN